ncbi:glycoside hydrolase family 97 catalytic domain-containing protein [Halococcus hamelinensis]|uniref:glycoside hydrolase family 97 catalytic domain-containing protein n=1 Tax=Halococcus hamelinensis TaxID=332168 RepID=UPI0009A17B2F|nr:glycoside hydrolase family 97 catalytic domain-containing protein [Halococcus hamelinensis]
MNDNIPVTHEYCANRRRFLGGVTAAMAAAAYTGSIPETVAGQVTNDEDGPTHRVESPDGSIVVTVDVSDGVPVYAVEYGGTTYLDESALGFDFRNQPTFGRSADGATGSAIEVTGSERGRATEHWDPVWGEFERVSAEYTSLVLGLAETDGEGRSANLEFRVFDEGVGFRFVLSDDFASNSERAVITTENTEFNFAGDYTSWWIRNEVTNPRFEQEYSETPLSEIPSGTRETRPTSTLLRNGAHTPLTVQAADDAYLSIHESNLEDYAAATIAPRSENGGTEFSIELTPLPDRTKVSFELPNKTPWRTIGVGSTPGALVESQLIPLLSDPLDESAFPSADSGIDTDWVTPRKYVGIWWIMIAGGNNWEYRPDDSFDSQEAAASYIHGARTERMKRYMTFASENGMDSVLAEGWNKGWDTYPGNGLGFEFGVDDSYPDFDVREVTSFGQSLDEEVEMTMHNETAGNLPNYEEEIQDDDIFEEYEEVGIRSIKNGYVSDPGLGIDGNGAEPTHNHHNQLAVNHHRLVMQNAAANRQMLEIHEGIKPTGEIRTYPNVGAREVVKAQEYDGFTYLDSDVDRDHHVTLPFTRMLAGPTSYQPGIFDITFNDDRGGQIQTTRAKQLAMYPNYLGGLQMAADRIEAYVNNELEVGQLVQAPSGELDGLTTLNDWRNAFGAHFVPLDPSKSPSGSSVEFVVKNVEAAGQYDLHLRYAADAEQNASQVLDAGKTQATLRVNGSATTISPSFTDYWDEWDVFTTTVDLEAGENTVALELNYEDTDDGFTGDVGGFNLNTVAVSEAGSGSPVPASYEGYTPENENFETKPEFAFIEDVPAAGWDETRVIDSAVADYIVTARQKDEEWYLGAMTDENGRAIDVPLDFLAPGQSGDDHHPGRGKGRERGREKGEHGEHGRGKDKGRPPNGPKYVAEIYSDDVGAGVDTDPTAVRIDEAIVTSRTTLLASMAQSGGTAVRIRRARGKEIGDLPTYEYPNQDIEVSIESDAQFGEPFISATGSNDAAFVGGTPVKIEVDGDLEASDIVRLPPNATDETIALGYSLSRAGEYDVVVRGSDGTVLASATVAVAPGEEIATFSDPSGDDTGPGEYVYPTDGAFEDGAFDLLSFGAYETDTEYLFSFEVANLYDTFGGSFSPHYFIVYLRDPTVSGGRTTTLDDLNVTAEFESPWQYRVDASGFGAGVTDASGTTLGTPETFVDFATNTVTVRVAKNQLSGLNTSNLEVVPVVGSEATGSFRAIEVEAGQYVFGGAKEGAVENAPRIIDLLTPSDASQTDVLAYDETSRAVLPFTPL